MSDQTDMPNAEAPAPGKTVKLKKPKRRKKILRRIVVAVVVLAILGVGAYYLYKLIQKNSAPKQEFNPNWNWYVDQIVYDLTEDLQKRL